MQFASMIDAAPKMQQLPRSLKFSTAVASAAFFVLSGCGSNSSMKPAGGGPTGQKPVIVSQPANISVPPGDTATFTVVAQGTGPLQYQWNDANGAISGATNATYSIANVSQPDSGSLYSVTVSNAAGSVTSIPVYLTVGPRSPKPGDLRFKGVDLIPNLQIAAFANIFGYSAYTLTNQLGSPMSMGRDGCVSGVRGQCGWSFDEFPLTPGMSPINTYYQANSYATFQPGLNSLASFDSVVSSLDLRPNEGIYAVSVLSETQNGGFDVAYHTVPLNGLQAATTQEGAQSRVITALSFNNGQVYYLSYGWALDTTTVYETQVATATPSNLLIAATGLAANGYIITAYGGDGGDTTNTYVLVGTRVKGDTLARPIDAPGGAVVAWVNGTTNNLAPILEN